MNGHYNQYDFARSKATGRASLQILSQGLSYFRQEIQLKLFKGCYHTLAQGFDFQIEKAR